MELATLIQILDKSACILLYVNSLQKDKTSSPKKKKLSVLGMTLNCIW